jgi:hypothetical protein
MKISPVRFKFATVVSDYAAETRVGSVAAESRKHSKPL